MKIPPKSVDAYLERPQHGAVLLYGVDSGLVRGRAKKLCQRFLNATSSSLDPFALSEFSENRVLSGTSLLADELSAISMMSPRRVIMISDAGDKLTRTLEASAPYLNNSTLLIVCADELSTRSSLRIWFEKSEVAAAIACYHDEARDVRALVQKQFDANGIQAGRETLDYICSQLGNDRGVTLQEIEKLVLYASDSKILSLEDARNLIDYNRETNFDDVINALADRNLSQLDTQLTLLQREGHSPVAYLRMMQRYFNRLYSISAMGENGKSTDEVVASLRPPVFFKQVPILTRHAQSWSRPTLIKALSLLTQAEHASKTSDLPIFPATGRYLMQITQLR